MGVTDGRSVIHLRALVRTGTFAPVQAWQARKTRSKDFRASLASSPQTQVKSWRKTAWPWAGRQWPLLKTSWLSCTTFRETSWESWPPDRIYTLFLSISSEGRVGKCIVSTWENCHGFLFPKATSPNPLPPSCVASPRCTHWWLLNVQSHSDCWATGTKMWQWLKGVMWTLEALPCYLWCLRDDFGYVGNTNSLMSVTL